MGWTQTYKPKGKCLKDFFAAEFNYDKDGVKFTVFDCAAKLNEAYLAIERIKENTRIVFAVVCLVRYYPKDPHYNIGYKDIDESMGPYYNNCPARILKLLTPTNTKYASEWRKKCWENINKKKNLPKFKIGETLEFEQPIQFHNGANLQQLTCIIKRPLRFKNGHHTYRLKKHVFEWNRFKIIKEPQ